MIREIATQRPAMHWAMIGPLQHDTGGKAARSAWDQLVALPNVHWLGAKGHGKVASYLVHLDVNAMSYVTDSRHGRWARYTHPLKLHEYLAAGRPVVSADLSELYQHHDVLETARTAEEWLAALERAIGVERLGVRPSGASWSGGHSCDSRVEDLEA